MHNRNLAWMNHGFSSAPHLLAADRFLHETCFVVDICEHSVQRVKSSSLRARHDPGFRDQELVLRASSADTNVRRIVIRSEVYSDRSFAGEAQVRGSRYPKRTFDDQYQFDLLRLETALR